MAGKEQKQTKKLHHNERFTVHFYKRLQTHELLQSLLYVVLEWLISFPTQQCKT